MSHIIATQKEIAQIEAIFRIDHCNLIKTKSLIALSISI
jgi:hypothetical protein